MTDKDDRLRELLASRRAGVLVTIGRDGRPQLSNIIYGYSDGVVRVSVTDDRTKTRNLRRDPRSSLYTTTDDFWGWVVADGTAELSPVAATPDDATVEELIDLYRALNGEHPDWDDYRRAMVDDRRLVVRLPVERLYGQVPG